NDEREHAAEREGHAEKHIFFEKASGRHADGAQENQGNEYVPVVFLLCGVEIISATKLQIAITQYLVEFWGIKSRIICPLPAFFNANILRINYLVYLLCRTKSFIDGLFVG